MRWREAGAEGEELGDQGVGDGFVDRVEVASRVGDDDRLKRDTGQKIVANHVVREVVLSGGYREKTVSYQFAIGWTGLTRRREGDTDEDLESDKVAWLVNNLVPIEDGLVDDFDLTRMAVLLGEPKLTQSQLRRDLDDSVPLSKVKDTISSLRKVRTKER